MKTKALYQLGANLLLWMAVPIVISVISAIRGNAQTFPIDELLKLIEPTQLLLFLAAGLVYFLLFAFIRHKSAALDDQNRATYFADLGFDEMATVLYSFGSVLIVTVLVGAPWWHAVAGIACWAAGYGLKPRESVGGNMTAVISPETTGSQGTPLK